MNFAELRAKHGHSQAKAAQLLGCCTRTVIRIEKGRMNDNQAAIYTAAYKARLSEEGKV